MKDMTEGSALRQIMAFAVPMLIASIFQQFYNLVDTLIVGRYLGADALAGVGSTGTLTALILNFALGMANGGGLILAQCFGKGDRRQMRRTIIAICWIMGILGIILSAVGFIFAKPLLIFLNVPEDVLGYALPYIRIILAFSFSSMIYNGAAAILRSVGDSRTPLYALMISSICNVGLDLFFIIVFHAGVAGAAAATVIAQFISGFFSISQIVKHRSDMGLTSEYGSGILPDRRTVALVVKTSVPSSFQSCMISIGNLSVQRLINSFGAETMAGYTAAGKIDSLAIQVILSVGNALCVFTGQNIGRGYYDRIREGLWKSRIIMLASAAVIAFCAHTFRYQLMGIFLDPTEAAEATEVGASYLSIIGVAYLVCAVMQSYQNVIRGAGDVNTCMVAGLTELAGRIFFAYLLAPRIGSVGIWLATPLSWSCGCVIPVIRYYSGKWKNKLLV
ncbi:MAG: MATE family efflux transporter [Lachnospiraceae bacterium]